MNLKFCNISLRATLSSVRMMMSGLILIFVCGAVDINGAMLKPADTVDAMTLKYEEVKNAGFCREPVLELCAMIRGRFEEGETIAPERQIQIEAVLAEILDCTRGRVTAPEISNELYPRSGTESIRHAYLDFLGSMKSDSPRVQELRLMTTGYYSSLSEAKKSALSLIGSGGADRSLFDLLDVFLSTEPYGTDVVNYGLLSAPKGIVDRSALAAMLLHDERATPEFYDSIGLDHEAAMRACVMEILANPTGLGEKAAAIDRYMDGLISAHGAGSRQVMELMLELRDPDGDEDDYERDSFKYPDANYIKRWYEIILPMIEELGEYTACRFFRSVGKVFDRMAKAGTPFDYSSMSLTNVLKRQRVYMADHFGVDSVEYGKFIRNEVIGRYGEYSEEYDMIMGR